MKKLLLLVLLVICTQSFCFAQSGYYETYDDFINNRFVSLDSVGLIVRDRATTEPGYSNIFKFKLKTNKRKLTRKIKKDVLLVSHHDSLMLNLSRVKTDETYFINTYVKAFLLDDGNICFVAPYVSSEQNATLMAAGMFGGILGATIATAGMNDEKNHRVYYINSGGGLKMIDYDFMCMLMGRYNPQLLIEYVVHEMGDQSKYEREVEKRGIASVVMDNLKRMNLL